MPTLSCRWECHPRFVKHSVFARLRNRSTHEAAAHLRLWAINMNKAFDSIKQGLQEAITHARSDNEAVRIYRPQSVTSRCCAPALP